METVLDSLYYRTSARPSNCGPYKNTSNYNNCSYDQVHNTALPSRTDFVKGQTTPVPVSTSEGFVQTIVSPPVPKSNVILVKQVLARPDLFSDIVGKDEISQIRFLKTNPQLISIVGKYHKNIADKAQKVIKEKFQNIDIGVM